MPDLTLQGLRIGSAMLDLSIWREGAATKWELTRGDPGMVEARCFARGPELL
jgi:hypothetical protein